MFLLNKKKIQEGIIGNELLISFLLIFLGIIFQIIRNPFPLIEPFLYAEDAGWTVMILNYGLGFALENGRPEYPIHLPIYLNYIAISLNTFLHGDNVKFLPLFSAFMAYGFYAFNALLTFKVVYLATKQKIPAFLSFISFLAIPLAENNTTIGLNLQWGHLVMYTATLYLLIRSYKGFNLFDGFFYSVCCFSNPVSVLVAPIIFFFEFVKSNGLNFSFEKIANFLRERKDWLVIIATFLICVIYLAFRIDTGSNTSGSTDSIDWRHFVEFAFYRTFLFHLSASAIALFDNQITILLILILYLVPLFLNKRLIQNHQLLVILCCLIAYLLAFSVTRGGITKILGFKDIFIHFYWLTLSGFSIALLAILWSRFKLIYALLVFSQIYFNQNLIFQKTANPPHLGWYPMIVESYEKSCGDIKCESEATDWFFIRSNPDPYAKIHLSRRIVEATVNDE